MAKPMVVGPTEFTAPRWAGDFIGHDSIVPVPGKLDPGQFAPAAAVVVTVGLAGAAAGATSVPVDALSGPIPNNTRLDFGAKGIVVLAANAAAGAVSLVTQPIPLALVDNEFATWPGTTLSSVPSGTVVGRTFAERDAGTAFGPAADADEEVYLIVFDVHDIDSNNDCEFYRPGGVVKENYLPVFASLSTAVKAILRDKYVCVTGKE